VRRALEELSRAGLVRVEQGRGSFIAEDVLDYAVSARTRFSEWIRAHNKEPGGQVLDLRERPADAAVAAGLGLRAGARIVRMDRLGLADGRPVSLSSHHFPAARFPGLVAALKEHATVTRALAEVGLHDYRRQVTRVTARMPQADEAELLRMPRNRPVLVTESVNVDPAGAVVEFGVTRYPTPRVQIVFES
jgi:GntR family phosphonate transport system transcriptional regulator